MNNKLAQEILMMHADALSTGTDMTDLLVARYPDLAPLLQLACSMQHMYEAVPVSAEFSHALHRDLLGTPPSTESLESRESFGWIMGAALGIGSAAATGLGVWAVRRFSANSAATPTPTPAG